MSGDHGGRLIIDKRRSWRLSWEGGGLRFISGFLERAFLDKCGVDHNHMHIAREIFLEECRRPIKGDKSLNAEGNMGVPSRGAPVEAGISSPSSTKKIPLDEFQRLLDATINDLFRSVPERSEPTQLRQLLQNDPQWTVSYRNFFCREPLSCGRGSGLRALWFAGRRLEGMEVVDGTTGADRASNPPRIGKITVHLRPQRGGGVSTPGVDTNVSPAPALADGGVMRKRRRSEEDRAGG